MLSLLLNEQNDTNFLSNNSNGEQLPIIGEEDAGRNVQQLNTVPKWSASNAFDPDSDEFWSGDDVVYEAFIDSNQSEVGSPQLLAQPRAEDPATLLHTIEAAIDDADQSIRERLEEEAHLIASGNESRRRRREQPWTSMETLLTPEPQDAIGEPVAITANGTGAGVVNPRVRMYAENIVTQHIPANGITAEIQRIQEEEPSLTIRGIRTLHPARITSSSIPQQIRPASQPSVHHLSPPMLISRYPSLTSNSTSSSPSPPPLQSSELITDVAHRTVSPLPYAPVFHRTRTRTPVSRLRQRRRESQPAPSRSIIMPLSMS